MTPQTGYIRSDFVEGVTQTASADTGNSILSSNESQTEEVKQDNADNKTDPNYTEKKGAVNGINVNVRKEPVTGTVMAKLSSGQTVIIKGEKALDNGQIWYQIAYKFNKDDYSGWVISNYIKVETLVFVKMY